MRGHNTIAVNFNSLVFRYKVFTVTIENEEHLDYLHGHYLSGTYDFWRERFGINETLDVMAAPEQIPKLLHDLKDMELSFTTMIENVGK